MASTNWFQMSPGLCYTWNKIFQAKSGIEIGQNFLVEMCGEKKTTFAAIGLQKSRVDSNTGCSTQLEKKKSLFDISIKANDPNKLHYRHQQRRDTDFIASQIMCRVSTHYWLPTTQSAAAAAGFGLNCKVMDGLRLELQENLILAALWRALGVPWYTNKERWIKTR